MQTVTTTQIASLPIWTASVEGCPDAVATIKHRAGGFAVETTELGRKRFPQIGGSAGADMAGFREFAHARDWLQSFFGNA